MDEPNLTDGATSGPVLTASSYPLDSRTCPWCKKTFTPKKWWGKYCSHLCRQLAFMLRKALTQTSPTEALLQIKDTSRLARPADMPPPKTLPEPKTGRRRGKSLENSDSRALAEIAPTAK